MSVKYLECNIIILNNISIIKVGIFKYELILDIYKTTIVHWNMNLLNKNIITFVIFNNDICGSHCDKILNHD